MKQNKNRVGVVYSTNPNYTYETDEIIEPDTLPKPQQRLRVFKETAGRGGKVATVVKGFVGKETDLKEIGKKLKTKLGVGGSVKDGEVIIQGFYVEQVKQLLKAEGYTDTK